MPLYNYHCKACRDYKEYLVPSSASHPLVCESCGKPGKLERLAVQKFGIGSTESKRKSISIKYSESETITIPVTNLTPQMAKACGGKLLAIVHLPSHENGVDSYGLWKIPSANN